VKPIVKRAIAAVAVKKAWDRYQQGRRPPKPSLWARVGIPAVVLATGGALAVLGKTGRLQPVVDQVRRGKPRPSESSTTPTPAPSA
jgi:hypothetical protein